MTTGRLTDDVEVWWLMMLKYDDWWRWSLMIYDDGSIMIDDDWWCLMMMPRLTSSPSQWCTHCCPCQGPWKIDRWVFEMSLKVSVMYLMLSMSRVSTLRGF